MSHVLSRWKFLAPNLQTTSDLIGEMENRASLENGEGGKYRRVK